MSQKTPAILASVPLFSGLEPHDLDLLAGLALQKNYRKGEFIFSDGDPGDGFYIVAQGQVKIFKASAEGKEQILHVFGPGEPIGEVAVFAGIPFPASAAALAKSVLLFFPRDAFIRLIAKEPALAMKLLAVLSMRLKQFTVQVENLSLKEVPGRIASHLLFLAEEQSNRDRVTLTISKGQLASLLGTIPETLSRIQAKMAAEGLIRVSGREITLLDMDRIEALAENGKL
ncbi:Crp/Fnr family transcriptional regulator [Desulfoluna spongiiphila]|uniref:Crp/Fnr family transcriptional regulator n=1 Tax=Desulfoluna spongiiphila TaxID=419481 RepID=UPI00125699D9|nr:Crp/Fnr family transcriptional regulator [Desulfoluna spongiiphila]VVS92016.1 camp-dependent protein kinase signature [Desulfoluna spongiiphila]